MNHSVDTALLRTFLEVQKTRHFGHAAENLYLTQSAVSFRIRQLELQLGVKLFERFRNNIQLTQAGKRLVPHAEAILNGWHQAVQEVGQGTSQPSLLALGAPPGIWDAYLQRNLAAIARQQPNLALRADSRNVTALCRGLLEHNLDLAILPDPPKVEGLASEAVGQLNLVLVSSRPEQDLVMVGETGYVQLDWGGALDSEQAKRFPQPLTPALQTSQCRIALEFILEVGGSAYLPENLVAPYLGQQLFPVVQAPMISRCLYAVCRDEVKRSLALESVLAQLKQDP